MLDDMLHSFKVCERLYLRLDPHTIRSIVVWGFSAIYIGSYEPLTEMNAIFPSV